VSQRWYVIQGSTVPGVTHLNSYARRSDADCLVARLSAHADEMGYDYWYEIIPGSSLSKALRASWELIERYRNKDLGAL
jgi:hypothetical protein